MLESWTQQAIKGALAKGLQGRAKCPIHKGLVLVLGPRGASWKWQRRVNGYATPRTIGLGNYPKLGLAEARIKAATINQELAEGLDVYVKHGVGVEAESAKPVRTTMTCQEAFDAFVAQSKNKESTKAGKRNDWKNHWQSSIGDMLVTDVTHDMLADVVEELRDERKLEGAANNCVRLIRPMMKWAERYPKRTGLHDSPARKLFVTKADARARTLSPQELKWVWQGALTLSPEWRDFFLLLILSGQRRSEVRGLERSEVDLVERYLDLPEKRMKNNLPHIVPLGPLGWRIVTERLRGHNSKFVFQSFAARLGEDPDDAPIGGVSKAMAMLRAKVQALSDEEGIVVERWTIHDLRRTFSTLANAMRGPDRKSLLDENHIERTVAHLLEGVKGTYNRHNYIAEKQHVLTIWEDRVREIVGEKLFEVY